MPHKDPEARRAYERAYRAANRERRRAQQKASYDTHKTEIQARRAKRLATLTEAQRMDLEERQRAYSAKYHGVHKSEISARRKATYAAAPDHYRAYWRAWRARHLFRARASARRWALAHRDAINLAKRKQRALIAAARPPRERIPPDPERVRALQRLARQRWRENHSIEERRERYRQYVERNRLKVQERARRYHEANRERRRQRTRERYQENPDPFRACAMAYHARKRGAEQGPIDHDAIILRDKGRCQICGKRVGAKERSFDHIVPLSRGGSHTQGNLQLTHFRCNARRGAGRIPGQIRLSL